MNSKVLVVFYSLTGNTATLARAIAQGARDQGAEVRLRQIEELLSPEWLEFHPEVIAAKTLFQDIPFVSQDDVLWADGIAFGSPTRFGAPSAQLEAFLQSIGRLWTSGALVEKVASVFTSTRACEGGPECTLSLFAPLFYMGFILLGAPLSQAEAEAKDEKGPTLLDLEIAHAQGRRLALASARLGSLGALAGVSEVA